MAVNNQTQQYIKTQIAHNLNLKDSTPQSKLSQLVDGFINETDNYEAYADSTLQNMFIQTCNENFLDKAGAQEGLSRNRLPSLRFLKNTGILTLQRTGPISTSKLAKGSTIQINDEIWATLLEEVDLATFGLEEVPISADIEIATLETGSLSLMGGASFAIEPSSSYYLNIKTDLSLPVIQESLEEFRARVAFSRYHSKFGSESAIRLAIASTSFVTDFHIDYSTNPFTIYLFSNAMLFTEDYVSNIESYAQPVVESHLLHRKAAGANFTIKTPSKAGFSITLKALKEKPMDVNVEIFNFIRYIERTYKVGTSITYNQDSLISHLNSLSIDSSFLEDYKIIFNRNYLSFTYASEDNNITVFEDEYPFLESITVE